MALRKYSDVSESEEKIAQKLLKSASINLSNDMEIIENKRIIVFVMGDAGSGKDFILEKARNGLTEFTKLKHNKTHSKSSTRKAREDEKDQNSSRSGTNIITSEEFSQMKANGDFIFDYEYGQKQYGINQTILLSEAQESNILFVPIALPMRMENSSPIEMVSTLNDTLIDQQTLPLFISLQNPKKRENLRNRSESTAQEIAHRLNMISTYVDNNPWYRGLINKGWIAEITSPQDTGISSDEGARIFLEAISTQIKKRSHVNLSRQRNNP